MTQKQYPLSDRLQTKYGIDPDDAKELLSVERTAQAKYVHAGSNGVFKRWWDIGRNVCAIGGVIWFLSSEWSGTKRDIADALTQLQAVASQVSALTTDVTTMQLQLYGLQIRDAARDATPAAARPRSRPSFARDEQFAPEPQP